MEHNQDNTVDETTSDATDAQNDTRVRVNYSSDADKMELSVKYDKEEITFPVGSELLKAKPEVQEHLMLMGLTTFFQRESSRAKDAEKLDAVEKAYERLMTEGAAAFDRKPGGGGSRGPLKADKIAALAALKNAPITKVEAALKKMSKEEQDKILNNKKVLAKLEKMKGGVDGEELDLAV